MPEFEPKKALPIGATGLLFAAAFPPFNFGLLVFVALVPWLLSLREATPKGAFRSGYSLGVLLWASQMWWLLPLTKTYVGSAWMGLIPLFIVCFLGSWYFAVVGWAIQKAMARGAFWAIPLLWAGMEVIRGVLPHLAFPYFQIATPLWPFPILTQAAFFGTIYLVSAWVVAVNVLVFIFMAKPKEAGRTGTYGSTNAKRLLLPILVLLLATGFRYAQPPSGKPIVVSAGQPGVDLAYSTPDEEAFRLKGAVAGLYREAILAGSQLLVLPEGIAFGENDHAPQTPFAIDPNVPILFGGQRFEMKGAIGDQAKPKIYQSAFGFDGRWSHADKARLVIFGEYVPGRGFLPFLDAFKLPSGDLSPAEKTSAMTLKGLKVGPLICFEGLFIDVADAQAKNGAQILAAMSIDDWYMGTGAPDQLRAATVWRAVETGLPTVRVGGLGYSMIIDSKGRVLREAPLGVTKALSGTVYVDENPVQNPLRVWVAYAMGIGFPILVFGLSRPGKASPEPKSRRRRSR